MIQNALSGLRALVGAAALSLVMATGASAVTWTFIGPGTTDFTQVGNVSTFTYDLNRGTDYAEKSWIVLGTAERSGLHVFDWEFSGFHSFFNVTAGLSAFNPGQTLVDAGPQNCCTPPSGGFNYTGTGLTFDVNIGDVFGFVITGDNFDSNNVLRGSLKLVDVSPVPLPGALGLLLGGTAMLGFVGHRRRRTT